MSNESAAKWLSVESLAPWSENPRINDHAVSEVAASIKRFGFGAPIVARKADLMVIAGHTRLKAAKLLGLESVPVRLLDLDPVDSKLLALADNKLNERSEWNDDQLAKIMRDIDPDSLAGLGWTDEELQAILESSLLAEPEAPNEEEPEPDFAIPEEPTTQPGDVIKLGRHTLHCGDCIEVMKGLDDNSIDAICTDPPYGIGFMGKDWDCAVPGDAFAEQALRVLKPGGHIIAFAATRTVHRLTAALEDAGFEIRDQIAWCQWQGFPKSLDVSKAIDKHFGAENSESNAQTTPEAIYWNGYGTALKPAYEPAVLARKPLDGTVANNVLKHETGGLNIDGCRIAYGDTAWPGPQEGAGGWGEKSSAGFAWSADDGAPNLKPSRFPANLYHCPKPSRCEREAGCDELSKTLASSPAGPGGWKEKKVQNHHPTVKPLKLMEWLARLILPPSGGFILEPFCGSGTTLAAVERISEEHKCIAIEMEPKYCDIIKARWEHHAKR